MKSYGVTIQTEATEQSCPHSCGVVYYLVQGGFNF